MDESDGQRGLVARGSAALPPPPLARMEKGPLLFWAVMESRERTEQVAYPYTPRPGQELQWLPVSINVTPQVELPILPSPLNVNCSVCFDVSTSKHPSRGRKKTNSLQLNTFPLPPANAWSAVSPSWKCSQSHQTQTSQSLLSCKATSLHLLPHPGAGKAPFGEKLWSLWMG